MRKQGSRENAQQVSGGARTQISRADHKVLALNTSQQDSLRPYSFHITFLIGNTANKWCGLF